MKDDRVYLLHIRDAAQRVLEYTKTGREDFFSDTKTQDAVIRNIEIIGEATKCLSNALKSAHSCGKLWTKTCLISEIAWVPS